MGKGISVKELNSLLEKFEKHKLMLTVLYASRLRRNELLNLRLENIETNDGKFRIRINQPDIGRYVPYNPFA
ncbi:MAG: tyrosine-type recombinase/integrase [Bacteroidales bacterium]|nr:tyrosine-type recombinase/integrase [Bacteroidales bacterium]